MSPASGQVAGWEQLRTDRCRRCAQPLGTCDRAAPVGLAGARGLAGVHGWSWERAGAAVHG
ncbi:MAG: hypothetical protein WAL22_12520, partial [Solirubrobacteraceae bacterium]